MPAGNVLGQIIKAFRSHFPKLTRQEFDSEFGAGIDESFKKLPSIVSRFNSEFREKMKDVKILCLSERRDSVLMWSHYAELHQGLVFEFACVPEVDSAWGAAKPVAYGDEMPRLCDEEFLIRWSSGQASLSVEDTMEKFVYAKAKDWAYEREWRVIIHFTDPDRTTQDIRFAPQELAAIYLGCRMSVDDRASVIEAVRRRYPGTRIFVAQKKTHEFGLEFDEFEPSAAA